MRERLALGLMLSALAVGVGASQPQFWTLQTAQEFLEGDLEGLAVDSEGRLRLSVTSPILHETLTPQVWSVARDGEGVLYLGTGNDGKILRVDTAGLSEFYDSAELEVHALAVGPDGRLYAGTSPDGRVYAIDRHGLAEVFFDPTEKYIWALAFGRDGRLLVATGLDGKLYRVSNDGGGEVALASRETHLTALAVDPDGNLLVGSAPGGIVYRLEASGSVFVLLDTDFREVKALQASAGGVVYAAVVDGASQEPSPPPPALGISPAPALSTSTEITVTAEAPAPPPQPIPPVPPVSFPPGQPKGAVIRILREGEAETLWFSAEDMPHSLAATTRGALVGTGNRGKLFEVRDDRTWSMLGVFPAEQVTALLRDRSGETWLATSNPGRIHRWDGTVAETGTFTSKPKDAGVVSAWGRLSWRASQPRGSQVSVRTRSGNTTSPDDTWSSWSEPQLDRETARVTSPSARFLQLQVSLTPQQGLSPEVESIAAAYLQRNLRPWVRGITVYPPGVVFQRPMTVSGEPEILGLPPGQEPEAPALGSSPTPTRAAPGLSRRLQRRGLQTVSWEADDPNRDDLVYDIHYRALGDRHYRLLREGLTESVVAWDTTTVPNGRYLLRVTALDSPSNPGVLALSGSRESVPFDVDNTPPALTLTLVTAAPPRVRAVASDDSSPIESAEYSVDAGPWQAVFPADGINDSQDESFDLTLDVFITPEPHAVVLRVRDRLGNVAAARIEVP